jgi:MYXO-CTERM domain-containing protein
MSVMTRLSLAAIVASTACVASASADLVVGWTIPNAFPSGAGNVPTGTSYSVGAADQGAASAGSSLTSVHALAAATYTSPAGNGSQYSFSSNNWKAGDYYEASFSTIGFSDLELSWDQARSSTGAKNFELIMSVDGGVNWITLVADYEVLQSGGGGAPGTWSTTTYNPIYSSVIALGEVADNQSMVMLRFRALVDAVSSSGAYAASGSGRIDNVFVTQVPAPGAVALLGVAGLVGGRRRR